MGYLPWTGSLGNAGLFSFFSNLKMKDAVSGFYECFFFLVETREIPVRKEMRLLRRWNVSWLERASLSFVG